jgi:hypothetical protein
VELALPDLPQSPEWSDDVVHGREFRRRFWSSAPRDARLVVGEDGVSALLGGDQRLTVRYADVIGLLEESRDEFYLVGSTGLTIPISRRDWRAGAVVVDAVRAAVPAQLQVRTDPEPGDVAAGNAVLLLPVPEHQAREAVWPAGQDLWFSSGERWCVVAPVTDHAEQLTALAVAASTALGKRHAVLLVSKMHDELSYVLYRGGREWDRHGWTGTPDDRGDRIALVWAAGIPERAGELAVLLAMRAGVTDVVDALTRALGLPEQVGPLLLGERPAELGLEFVPARGFVDGMRATFRGEYDAPDGWYARFEQWRRDRPRSYRVVSVVEAALLAVVAWWSVARSDGDWISWWGLLAVVAGLSAVGGLWDAYAPRRVRRDDDSGGRPAAHTPG